MGAIPAPAKWEEIWDSACGLRLSSLLIFEMKHAEPGPELNIANGSLAG